LIQSLCAVWQQFSRLNPSVYSAALHGGCCVLPCVADVSIDNCGMSAIYLINEYYYIINLINATAD